jgi:hypothetical protein
MHPRPGRHWAYWACAGTLDKAVIALTARIGKIVGKIVGKISWRMSVLLGGLFRARLMYEVLGPQFKPRRRFCEGRRYS